MVLVAVRFCDSDKQNPKNLKQMKKDMIIFVMCCIAATTIESTGEYFIIPLSAIIIAFVLSITKFPKKRNDIVICDDDQLLDISTRNDVLC